VSVPIEAVAPTTALSPVPPEALTFIPRERAAIRPADLAEAVMSSGIRTVLVLEGDRRERSLGGLALLRALSAKGASAVILDFGVDTLLSEAMGVPSDAFGVSDYIDGSTGLADILYRDLASSADVIVWGRDGNGQAIDFDRFDQLFAAIAATYDCAVIDGGTMPASGFLGFLNDDAAIVVTSDATSSSGPSSGRFAELKAAGQHDALLMETHVGTTERATEAA
jgi:MinD-like ATPase involved in chromosome partitioning or flagellar assembly